jgi:branched-chain amino acid transport system permease protein
MSQLIQLTVGGLAIGAIYGMVALGFVLVYKATGAFNFAQGQILFLGATICGMFSLNLGLPFYIAVILTLAVSFGLGFVIERLLLRPMFNQPVLAIVMMTLMLAVFLNGLITATWGTSAKLYPSYLPEQSMILLGTELPPIYFWGFVVTMILLVGFSLFFKFSKQGLAMRATAESQLAAQSIGISLPRMFGISWAISCLTAAAGGIIIATMLSINVSLPEIGLRVIPVVMVGGLDSIPGAVVGGILIGIIENFAGGYLGEALINIRDITPYVVLLLILLIRPYGLWGSKRIERI